MAPDLLTPPGQGDDGRPDPRLRAALESGDREAILAALRTARVLVGIEARLLAADAATGADKLSEMALVTLRSSAGTGALPVFTGLDTLTAWRPSIRPVPVTLPEACAEAARLGLAAVVLDLGSPWSTTLDVLGARGAAAAGPAGPQAGSACSSGAAAACHGTSHRAACAETACDAAASCDGTICHGPADFGAAATSVPGSTSPASASPASTSPASASPGSGAPAPTALGSERPGAEQGTAAAPQLRPGSRPLDGQARRRIRAALAELPAGTEVWPAELVRPGEPPQPVLALALAGRPSRTGPAAGSGPSGGPAPAQDEQAVAEVVRKLRAAWSDCAGPDREHPVATPPLQRRQKYTARQDESPCGAPASGPTAGSAAGGGLDGEGVGRGPDGGPGGPAVLLVGPDEVDAVRAHLGRGLRRRGFRLRRADRRRRSARQSVV